MHTKKLLSATALFATLLATSAKAQLVSSLAGIGEGVFNAGFSGDGGRATVAALNVPFDVAIRTNGDLYFSDKLNNRVRKIAADGIITTVAGTGLASNTGDGGPATAAAINSPTAIAADAAGNLYIVCNGNLIRKINPSGVISTFAGTGSNGFGGDGGQASAAAFNSLSDIAILANGDMLLADGSNHRIRKITAAGVISTVAGNGTGAFAGDGGAATSASLNFPSAVASDNNGGFYIADWNNKRIRLVNAAGTISTVVGNGSNNVGDGPALSIGLKLPSDLAVGANGVLYFAELLYPAPGSNLRSLNNGTVSTIMTGTTSGGQGQGGPLSGAHINTLRGLVTDAGGNLYLADPDDSRIVMVCNSPALAADSARYLRPGVPDHMANPFMAMERCKLICRFENTGQALTTNLEYKVRVAASTYVYQGRPFVKRGYDLMTTSSTALAGKLTLYFTQVEFSAYNATAAAGHMKLPTGPGDAANIPNLLVMHYSGTGTAPGTYSGAGMLMSSNPAVSYNVVNDRWEVTVPITETGGYYITTPPQLAVPGADLAPQSLRVWPRETSGTVSVDAQSAVQAALWDAMGRRVMRLDLKPGRQTVDVSALPAGVYQLRSAQGASFRIIRL